MKSFKTYMKWTCTKFRKKAIKSIERSANVFESIFLMINEYSSCKKSDRLRHCRNRLNPF